MNKKISKIGRRGKFLLVFVVILVSVSLASASLLSYFGKITTTVDVQQSIQIDGMNWDEPLTEEIEAIGGCCYCFEHEVTNQGCEPMMLDWDIWGTPDLEGIDVLFTREPYLGDLVINVLDGFAEYDDFDVYVGSTLVYTYEAEGGDETWVEHTIDLLPFEIPMDGTHTITIECTADEPWEHFETYGQLAVDTIELYCELGELCDSVDIGKTTSEAPHNLIGWGPIEPANSGGAYGGIDDCRCTWITDDDPWASVDLTCEYFCVGCGADECVGIEFMDEPFEILPGETIEFCICYDFDMLIAPQVYTIHAKLIPAVI